MLPSLRHFMRFIDLDDVFEGHGFYRKVRYIIISKICAQSYNIPEWGRFQT